MSDVADDAQEIQAKFNAQKLDEQKRAARLDAPGAEHCADCGEPIPDERRRAMPSAHRCIVCQAFIERIGWIQRRNHA